MSSFYYITRANIPGQGKQKFYLAQLHDGDYWFAKKEHATKFNFMVAHHEIKKRKAIHNLDLYNLEPAQ